MQSLLGTDTPSPRFRVKKIKHCLRLKDALLSDWCATLFVAKPFQKFSNPSTHFRQPELWAPPIQSGEENDSNYISSATPMNTREPTTVTVVGRRFAYGHSDCQRLAASGAMQRIAVERLAKVATVPLTGNGCRVDKWLSPTVLQRLRLFAAGLKGCGGWIVVMVESA